MATRKISYGTSTSITCTLASLAQAAARECTVVDNGTNLYIDAMLYLAVKLQTGTPGSDKVVNVYLYVSEDGTNYTDNATGSDAAVTLRSPTNLIPAGQIACPDSGGLTYKFVIPSIASICGGILPRKWGIVVENRTNVTFSATEGDHAKTYTGIYETVA